MALIHGRSGAEKNLLKVCPPRVNKFADIKHIASHQYTVYTVWYIYFIVFTPTKYIYCKVYTLQYDNLIYPTVYS